MPPCRIKPAKFIYGKVVLPGDKSIAHRSIFISSIAQGKTYIHNFPLSRDCLAAVRAFRALGIKILRLRSRADDVCFCVEGGGLHGLKKHNGPVFTADSGTTFRLMLGVLAGQPFSTILTGGLSLRRRPMKRVTEPLRLMGAVIKSRRRRLRINVPGHLYEEYAPITIRGAAKLKNINYKIPVASAQVKSAILLAGLYAKGTTNISESINTRNHTEIMLRDFGANIKTRDKFISMRGRQVLVSPGKLYIPGDISSASFFIVAAIILPGSHLELNSVGINPSRLGLVQVLRRMGARIKVVPYNSPVCGSEPVGDIIVESGRLRGITISRNQIPSLIDELPILMLAACYARGKTVIQGVEELRVKETDRIKSMQANLTKMGAKIEVKTSYSGDRDKIIITGTGHLHGAAVRSFSDHRTAMSMVIAGFASKGRTTLDDTDCIAKSFPGFMKSLSRLVK